MSFGADRLLGVTQTLRRELVATQSGILTSTSGAYAENTLILNTAYHLDSATLNSEGFTAYMGFYSKCWVLRSRIKVKVVSAAGAHPWFLGSVISTNGASFGTKEKAIDNGLCDWQVGFQNPDRATFTTGVDHARFLGKPKYLDDPQLFCTTSAAPSQIVVWHLCGQSTDGATTIQFYYTVEVVQSVVFTDPIPF